MLHGIQQPLRAVAVHILPEVVQPLQDERSTPARTSCTRVINASTAERGPQPELASISSCI